MPETTQDLITWIIGALLINIVTLGVSIISWIKSAKMMPKEIKGAELNNISKEISIANQLDELATKAADRTLKTQSRLDKLELDYENLEAKVKEQDEIIRTQNNTIKEQTGRLDMQDKKMKEQEDEIEFLKCELKNSKLYNQSLINQMREKNIIPIDIAVIQAEDCEKKKRKKMNLSKEEIE